MMNILLPEVDIIHDVVTVLSLNVHATHDAGTVLSLTVHAIQTFLSAAVNVHIYMYSSV